METEPKQYSESQVIDLIWDYAVKAGSKAALSKKWGIADGYLGDVLHKRTSPGPKILKAMGLEKIDQPPIYREKAKTVKRPRNRRNGTTKSEKPA